MQVRGSVRSAVLVVLAACGGASTADRVAEHDRERTSWEQTALFVGDGWIASQIPTAYAHRTLAATLEALTAESRAIGRESIDDSSRVRLELALTRSRRITAQLDSAIADNDPSAAASAFERATPRGTK